MSEKAAREHLQAFVERIERIEEEQKALADDKRDIYGEAKSVGYSTKMLRRIVRLRKLSPDQRVEDERELAVYLNAMGMHTEVEVGPLEEALERKRSEVGKAKSPKDGEKLSRTVPRGETKTSGGLSVDQVKADADRAEARSRAPP